MEFEGFAAADFDVFAIDDFEGRMAGIRASIRPKLAALGADLAADVEEAAGAPLFPHVAQHMRRRVNPPAETWVAFARDKLGYKRWTHYRVAVSGAGVRVTVFVEDDADDKAQFGANLEAAAEPLLKKLRNAPVQWYTLAEEPVRQAELTTARLAEVGASLQRLKTAKFQAGAAIPRDQAIALGAEGFEAWALEHARILRPLYLAGVTADFRP